MITGVLRSSDRPSGWPLSRLLREIRLDVEGQLLQLPDDHPSRGRALQILGHLLTAEGLDSENARQLELVAADRVPRLAR